MNKPIPRMIARTLLESAKARQDGGYKMRPGKARQIALNKAIAWLECELQTDAHLDSVDYRYDEADATGDVSP
jgi:hypothetical protein